MSTATAHRVGIALNLTVAAIGVALLWRRAVKG